MLCYAMLCCAAAVLTLSSLLVMSYAYANDNVHGSKRLCIADRLSIDDQLYRVWKQQGTMSNIRSKAK